MASLSNIVKVLDTDRRHRNSTPVDWRISSDGGQSSAHVLQVPDFQRAVVAARHHFVRAGEHGAGDRPEMVQYKNGQFVMAFFIEIHKFAIQRAFKNKKHALLGVALEDGDGVDGVAEVPQAEGGVAAAGDHEALAVVRAAVRQLLVVARQRADHLAPLGVENQRRAVPRGRDDLLRGGVQFSSVLIVPSKHLTAAAQPVGRDDHIRVAGQFELGRFHNLQLVRF